MSKKIQVLKAVLIDLSGTLHIEDVAIPGAAESLDRLRRTGLKIKFVTNTTKECQQSLQDRLSKLGFSVEKSEILTSLSATSLLCRQRKLRPLLFLEEDALVDFEGISTNSPHNAVVVGLAPSMFNYSKLSYAFQLIHEGAPLIAVHKAKYYQTLHGLALGPGAFVSGLEYATGKQAEIIGKPSAHFFNCALSELQVAVENTCMIGDDVHDDCMAALNLGMSAYLVQTGKYQSGDENKVHDKSLFYTGNSFVDAVETIELDILKSRP